MRIAPFLALAAVVFGVAFGQQTAPFESGTVIRATTNLVQVRVVAEDSKGDPVTDLKRADFEIQDNHKPQPITLFTADRGSRAATDSPGVRPDSEEASPGYSVLLLDWLNTTYTHRLQAQEQVIDLLKKYQPRQRVAIFLIDRDPRLLSDFTSDMPGLIQAVEDAGLDFGLGEDDRPGRFEARNSGRGARGNTEIENLSKQNDAFDTLHALETIADHLAHVPGRKSLIWVTAGFAWSIGGIDFLPRVETALDKLNKSDVAVYAVNACGLSTTCRSNPGPMSELAERTGGTIFAGRNDLDEGVRTALEDMRISYTLGFNVPEGAALGLHEIRVRVNRAGIRLRYRESYGWAGNR